MGVQITVRDLSERARDSLAARAATRGQSMQEYLRLELERLASRPTPVEWLAQVRARKRASETRLSAGSILKARNADRR